MEKTRSERIRFLRDIKEKHGLNTAQICDIVSQNGGYVSESTVQRVFAKGAEYKNFQYHTVAPIYNAFAAVYGDESIPNDTAELKRTVTARDQRIDELLEQLESQKEHHKEQVALFEERKKRFEETISTLTAELDFLKSHVTEQRAAIARKDAIIERILSVCMKIEKEV